MTDKPPALWKKTIVASASFGAGFAIVSALLIGAYLWYMSRPKPPIPWNSSALVASYDFLDTEGDDTSLVFYYTLENKTDFDYYADKHRSLTVMARLDSHNLLRESTGDDAALKLDYPIFIPAKHKVRIALHFGYALERPAKAKNKNEDKKSYRKSVEAYLNKEAPTLHGFVLFDQANKYEIDLPRGW